MEKRGKRSTLESLQEEDGLSMIESLDFVHQIKKEEETIKREISTTDASAYLVKIEHFDAIEGHGKMEAG